MLFADGGESSYLSYEAEDGRRDIRTTGNVAEEFADLSSLPSAVNMPILMVT